MLKRKENNKVACTNNCGAIVMPRGLKSHLSSCKKGSKKGIFLIFSNYIQTMFVLLYWLNVLNVLPKNLSEPLDFISFKMLYHTVRYDFQELELSQTNKKSNKCLEENKQIDLNDCVKLDGIQTLIEFKLEEDRIDAFTTDSS